MGASSSRTSLLACIFCKRQKDPRSSAAIRSLRPIDPLPSPNSSDLHRQYFQCANTYAAFQNAPTTRRLVIRRAEGELTNVAGRWPKLEHSPAVGRRSRGAAAVSSTPSITVVAPQNPPITRQSLRKFDLERFQRMLTNKVALFPARSGTGENQGCAERMLNPDAFTITYEQP